MGSPTAAAILIDSPPTDIDGQVISILAGYLAGLTAGAGAGIEVEGHLFSHGYASLIGIR
jgi:hypothetical protein